jgi:hypothetical protein
MDDIVRTTVSAGADVLYIGYPKAASVFVGKFLTGHPEVSSDHQQIAPLLLPGSNTEFAPADRELCRGRVHISRDESVAESLCIIGDGSKWARYCYVPGAWDQVKREILVDPGEAASRLRDGHPHAKVLMIIREQADWLNSAYKYTLNELPAGQRSFAEYCATPYGAVLLQAGYFDQTIRAYVDVFGASQVCVLRYEDIEGAPDRFAAQLCSFVGISERMLPRQRENESHAQVARLLRLFPAAGRLPRSVKDAIKPHVARFLPGARGVLLSAHEIAMLRSMYAVSNERTEKLLEELSPTRQSR